MTADEGANAAGRLIDLDCCSSAWTLTHFSSPVHWRQ
jgi:hypothetical protein